MTHDEQIELEELVDRRDGVIASLRAALAKAEERLGLARMYEGECWQILLDNGGAWWVYVYKRGDTTPPRGYRTLDEAFVAVAALESAWREGEGK